MTSKVRLTCSLKVFERVVNPIVRFQNVTKHDRSYRKVQGMVTPQAFFEFLGTWA